MKALQTCETECTKNTVFSTKLTKKKNPTSVGLRASSKLSMKKAVRRDSEEAEREQSLGTAGQGTQ